MLFRQEPRTLPKPRRVLCCGRRHRIRLFLIQPDESREIRELRQDGVERLNRLGVSWSVDQVLTQHHQTLVGRLVQLAQYSRLIEPQEEPAFEGAVEREFSLAQREQLLEASRLRVQGTEQSDRRFMRGLSRKHLLTQCNGLCIKCAVARHTCRLVQAIDLSS